MCKHSKGGFIRLAYSSLGSPAIVVHTEEAKNPVMQTIKLSISAAVGAEGLEGSGELLTLVCIGIQEELALTWAKECQSNRTEQRSSTFLMLGPLPQLLMLC